MGKDARFFISPLHKLDNHVENMSKIGLSEIELAKHDPDGNNDG